MLLDLFLAKTDELIRDVKTSSSLGCTDHALVIMFLMDMRRGSQETEFLDFQFFEEFLNGLPGKLPSGTKKVNKTDSSLRKS